MEASGDNHCAYCLKTVSAAEVKKCGKCNRRVYCGKECQLADWKAKFHVDPFKQRGQGHKNWCGLDYGEEGLDWKIASIEGKGLGVVALRHFPARSRIMIDACQLRAEAHPEPYTLMPEAQSLSAKFELNALGVDAESGKAGGFASVLCLRLSRVNHACRANADHVYLDEFGVKVLYSERDIAAGEEITINYTVWNDISTEGKVLEMNHVRLKSKWGIDCPSDCVARDPEIAGQVERARGLDRTVYVLASSGKPERALRAVKQLLAAYDSFGGALIYRKRTLYDGFQIGILRRNTIKDGIGYLRQLHELVSKILHPQDSYMKKCEGWMKNPSSHRNYWLNRLKNLGMIYNTSRKTIQLTDPK